MRILWITNIPVSKHKKMLQQPYTQSGGWLEIAYGQCKENQNFVIGIATFMVGLSKMLHEYDGNNHFYVVPCVGNPLQDISENKKNIEYWNKVINDFHPDIIHLWGTEFSHGLCALKTAKNIPSIVYIQGMVSQIAHHYDAGISIWNQMKNLTIRDFVRHSSIWNLKKLYIKRAKVEAEILKISKHVIVENKWCAFNCEAIVKDCSIFYSLLPINPIFATKKWKYGSIVKHTIFTNAGTLPIKGTHILLQALAIVKQYYPDVKVIIPGSFSRGYSYSTYYKYLQTIIKQNNLQQHIAYVGALSQEQMAERIQSCHVFVMPSSIENHSSTLIEAMMVGAPVIASNVGGVAEYLRDGNNGYLYRFDEFQTLAAIIIHIFNHPELAQSIAEQARIDTQSTRCHININSDFEKAYNSVLTQNNIMIDP